jgi:hypothetical protein
VAVHAKKGLFVLIRLFYAGRVKNKSAGEQKLSGKSSKRNTHRYEVLL